MIYFRGEGEVIRNGFNFYPKSEWATSRGFIFRLHNWKLWCRYSTKLKKLILRAETRKAVEAQNFEIPTPGPEWTKK